MKKRNIFKRVCSGVLACSMIASGLQMTGANQMKVSIAKAAVSDVHEIVVDGNDIKTDNVNGLTYKGFGILSGNATSDLLLDYKSEAPEAYAKLMQYLFGGKYPIMNHVKLEMGNDRNNSTGPQPATKRTQDEKVNVKRDPSWQIAADAKKINPDVKISILKWNAPTWANDSEKLYQWYKESILAAYEEYGYMIDYMNPNTNERWDTNWDVKNTKFFKNKIESEDETTIPDKEALELYKKIKIIVSDEAATVNDAVGATMKSDEEFYNAVDVVGYHYSPNDDSKGSMKWLAEEKDKEVWNSEAQATFSDSIYRAYNNMKSPKVEGTGIGGPNSALEMGNTIIKGFCVSRRSHVIYQPAIGSFYEGGQYAYKELVSAREPWSGWIHYDAGLLVLAHISKFAKLGWENEDNTAGIWRAIPNASKSTATGTNPVVGRGGGANYMTLGAPAKDNFSTVIINDSEYEKNYKISTKNMNLKEDQKLELWETRALDDGQFNENYMKCLGKIEKDANGAYTVKLKPNSIVTVTTLDMAEDEEHLEELPVEGRKTILDTDATGSKHDVASEFLYADDFAYEGKKVKVLDGKGGFTDETEDYIEVRGGDTGAIPRYTNVYNGAFEVFKNTSGNYVMRQQLDRNACGVGGAWNDGDPAVLIGDKSWMNYSASVKALFEHTNGSPYAAVAIRQTGSSHKILDSSGYTFKLMSTGKWYLYRKTKSVKTGTITEADGFKKGANVWNTIKLEGKGNEINAYVNEKLVSTYTDATPITSGRVALGSAYTFTQFDDLQIKKIEGMVPYYKEYLDNLQMYDLTKERNSKLIYNSKWKHENGKGMYCYHRSVSTNKSSGARVTYHFKGTGLELLGETKAGAEILVYVDDVEKDITKTIAASNMNTFFSLSGLDYGVHKVTFQVISGTVNIDAVGVLGKAYKAGDAEEDNEDVVTPQTVDTDPGIRPTAEPTATPVPTVSPTEAPKQTEAPVATPVPDNNTTEEVKAFTVKNLKYSVTKAGKEVAFVGCAKKKSSVTIPATVSNNNISYKVVSVNANALKGNTKITKLTIGKNITKIGAKAFSGCKKLKTITIQTGKLTKKNVGAKAFEKIVKKAKVKTPKRMKKAYKKLLQAKGASKKIVVK